MPRIWLSANCVPPDGERGFSNVHDGTVNARQSQLCHSAKTELQTFTLALTFEN